MQALKSLNFAAIPKHSFDNPVDLRRAKLIAKLEEQKALLDNPTFVAVAQPWEKTSDGSRELVTRRRRVRRWWREDATGKVYLTFKYGQKAIEFEKDKGAIAVPNKEAIAGVLDVIMTAVRNGELDDALTAVCKMQRFKRRT
jgi:hypothetical protein